MDDLKDLIIKDSNDDTEWKIGKFLGKELLVMFIQFLKLAKLVKLIK